MKYVILADSDNVEDFKIPRQLLEFNGESLLKRTVRLLKENGVNEILITSHDKRFDNLGAERYEPQYNSYNGKKGIGYWLDAFPIELLNEPVTFLFGDVYFSENAIKQIVNTQTDSILFFCSSGKDGYSDKYIKHHDEPFGFKVVNYDLFKEHIQKVKKMYDYKLTRRHPIAWELYRSINNIDVNMHLLTENYIPINDESCDIDAPRDILSLQIKIGGYNMIKVKVIKDFSLADFYKVKNLVRANQGNNQDGFLYINDIFECDKELCDYLMGNNRLKLTTIEVLEIIPEKEESKKVEIVFDNVENKSIEIKPEIIEALEKAEKPKTTKKKKTSKKKAII